MTKYLVFLAAAVFFIACDEDKQTVVTDNDSCGLDRNVCATDWHSVIRCSGGVWMLWEDCGENLCEIKEGVGVCAVTTDEIQTPGDEDDVNDDDAVVAGYTLTDVVYTDLLEQSTADPSNIEQKRYEIFRDQAVFALFFTSLDLGIDAPVVDFESDMVIVLYNGTASTLRPIYEVDGIKKLVPDDPEDIHRTVLFVYTTTHYYSDKLPADQMFYYPLRLIKVEKADFVNFNDRFVIERSY